mgnify:CR=1 FL=1
MNQKIKLSQGIKYVIIGAALLLFLMVWPLGILQNRSVFKSDEVQSAESGPVSVANNETQMFLAKGKI